MTQQKRKRIARCLYGFGLTTEEIADVLGVSFSTIQQDLRDFEPDPQHFGLRKAAAGGR